MRLRALVNVVKGRDCTRSDFEAALTGFGNGFYEIRMRIALRGRRIPVKIQCQASVAVFDKTSLGLAR